MLPDETEITSVYPNPFNPSTTISFNTNKDSYVELLVYDIHGKQVELLINQFKTAGQHSINCNASLIVALGGMVIGSIIIPDSNF